MNSYDFFIRSLRSLVHRYNTCDGGTKVS